jgi:alkylation response protein AidB-like acyl-CoA dehydrogenase
MDQGLSTAEIRQGLREFLTDHDCLAEVRQVADTEATGDGFDRKTWRRLATELGVTSLAVPEEFGGLGLGVGAVVGSMLEAGRELYPGPLRTTATVTLALLATGGTDAALPGTSSSAGEPRAAALRAIASEAAIGALAGPVDDVRGDCGLRWDGAVLSGRARAIQHGAAAHYLLAVAAGSDGGPVLVFLGETALASAVRHRRPGMDFSTPYADLEVDAVPATILTDDPGLVDHVLDLAQLLTAAEQIGLAQGALDRTLDYLRIREQFGRVIGGYQALQHRCADLVTHIEAALALVEVATAAADAGDRDTLGRTALLARAAASEVSVDAADTMLQLHGGIGFTWEHGTHLYFRRARGTAVWFGTVAQLRAEAVRRNCFGLITRELGA